MGAEHRFSNVIRTEAELRAIVGAPRQQTVDKEVTALDRHCRKWLELSPFVLLATSDADGRCDVSPRGDAPGFVRVLDDRTIAIPERPGNRRADSLVNILANPHVALLVLIPGVRESLRIEGVAQIVGDEELLATMAVGDKVPALAVVIAVEKAFLHCAKAVVRSKLWRPTAWPATDGLASPGQILKDHAGLDIDAAEIDAYLERGTRKRLY